MSVTGILPASEADTAMIRLEDRSEAWTELGKSRRGKRNEEEAARGRRKEQEEAAVGKVIAGIAVVDGVSKLSAGGRRVGRRPRMGHDNRAGATSRR
ncbi:hypothetical protein BHM03_00007778 [Ensete ventricosum]|nr:hypothetical protein BHM03_00007778 [Ensete ventricosum]